MNVCQVAVILVGFLDCENVEPACDLGNELPVVARSLLDAEVRDVPCGDQQPVLSPGGYRPRLLVLSEMVDFVRDVVRVLELRLRERRHRAPLGVRRETILGMVRGRSLGRFWGKKGRKCGRRRSAPLRVGPSLRSGQAYPASDSWALQYGCSTGWCGIVSGTTGS